MPEATSRPGETVRLHFVWELPNGDYLRALYNAEVLALDESLDRYLLRLTEWVAGRQEDTKGQMRPPAEMDREYWAMAERITGRRLYLAYEATDGRPIHLRLDTLTGQHTFFYRLDPLEAPPEED